MQATCLILFLLFVTSLGQSDMNALLELKKSIQKDPSGQVLISWDSKSLGSDGCPQNWLGIVCSEGHVTSITLDNVGLVGDFNFHAVGGLEMLRNLTISNNQFKGDISKIGSMESLEFLDLSHNNFRGLVPSDLVYLHDLVYLNLSLNQLEGTLPAGFGKLKRLKYLDLQGNSFSGDVMHLLSDMGSVVHVDLSFNRFAGSLDLGLGDPSFISSIQYLNVSHNSLYGELFTHDGMPYFDNLEVFDASNNQLAGVLPSFNFVVSLRILRLASNQLTGSLPEALLQESSMLLSEMDLSQNKLEGPIRSITSATLKKLNISSNKLSGPLPLTVGHCAVIDLSNNMLSGNLSRIQFWGNYVEVVQLSSNLLTGILPNKTSQFLRLTELKIANNSLTGVLPPMLGTCPELQVIDLSLNQLSGFLLPSFFNSAKLTDLDLSGNSFSGSIPIQEIGNNSFIGSAENFSLLYLDLSYNNLSGNLPSEMSKFHNLEYLDLSNNKFEGSIPDNLPHELRGFNVSFNNLSGMVPGNLMGFPESAFHPGNFLLIFPYSPSSPKVDPSLGLREHGSHLKSSTRTALAASLVSGALMMVLLCTVIYFRAQWQKCKISSERNGKRSTAEGTSPTPQISAPNRNEESLPSLNFHSNTLPSLLGVSALDDQGTSSVVNKPKDLCSTEPIKKDEGIFSPVSFLSASDPSPSTSHPRENPGVLKVCSPDKLAGDLHLFDSSLAFTAEELSCAPAEAIGRSCHGTLYKAMLNSGHVLVVKWLRDGIAKGRKEFAREMKKLGNIKHPNLVSLKGYYWGPKEHEKLIISNYINGQSLDIHLHEADERNLRPMSLDERLKVAIEVARCLNYLHNEKAIPHGNLKSTNILLETPKQNVILTDYSLHRILTAAGTTEQVLNAGALGYRPPEFASSSKPCPSLKSDVYAFGVILLELLTGKSSGEIVSGIPGVVDLTDWVRFLAHKNRSAECFDKVVLYKHGRGQLPRVLDNMLQVGLRCILSASERPDMKTVFEDLSMIR
ncbi:LRR receptor-like kinase family protein [Quillaja saponaria]|uniref:LRR receptor-like kinase family protein n=1 Tax=Quillaja saponaria TaxID=32244 RepID=A0AAD7PRX9_QUISA|nr:LRR receptor-like kinase family protein [Quillaja saponaria]